MTSRTGSDSTKLGGAADTVGPKSSPPFARKSVVPTVSVASSAIGCRRRATDSMAIAPPAQRARARMPDTDRMPLSCAKLRARSSLERARRQLQRRQPIVERQRLEQRAVGQFARGQIGAQPAAVGQPDVGVRGVADLVGHEVAERRLRAIRALEHRRQRHADLARLASAPLRRDRPRPPPRRRDRARRRA